MIIYFIHEKSCHDHSRAERQKCAVDRFDDDIEKGPERLCRNETGSSKREPGDEPDPRRDDDERGLILAECAPSPDQVRDKDKYCTADKRDDVYCPHGPEEF